MGLCLGLGPSRFCCCGSLKGISSCSEWAGVMSILGGNGGGGDGGDLLGADGLWSAADRETPSCPKSSSPPSSKSALESVVGVAFVAGGVGGMPNLWETNTGERKPTGSTDRGRMWGLL